MRTALSTRLSFTVLALVLACGLAVAGEVAPVDALRPGQFAWAPELAPHGPVLVVVSLPAQRAWVYRNGVRIGTSTVSTGRRGHETPVGVYTILQKAREHYSNLYDSAPMPFMQRLTWDGIALHAGHLPGYPASHGCIRLPPGFAELLFAATARETTVVVTDAPPAPPPITAGPFASGARSLPAADGQAPTGWAPERAPEGPLTLLLATAEQQLLVLRNGIEIGRADVVVAERLRHGTYAYALLEGTLEAPAIVHPDRPALPWTVIRVEGDAASPPDLRQAAADGELVIPPAFARQVYDLLVPGTTLIVSDEPLPD
jgi:hypothetical protein